MRVLHLSSPIGRIAWNLSIAERTLGIESKVVVTGTHIYYDECYDQLLRLPRNYLGRFLAVFAFYVKAIRRYDVFHFNCGSSFFSHINLPFLRGLDLRILKIFKKVIYVTYFGSDARQASYCLKNHSITYFTQDDEKSMKASDSDKRKAIAQFDKYADKIFAISPDLLPFLPERAMFLPLTKLKIDEYEPSYSDYSKETLTIVHAPSNRKVKGTDTIISVIERLKGEGFSIVFKLIENVPNSEAISMFKDADIVIDQILAGWYGGVSIECMAFGKPSAVYIREEDMRHIPQEMYRDMPFLMVTPDTLYDVLKEHIINRELLREKAVKSREYVLKWHDSNEIARHVIMYYEKDIKERHGNNDDFSKQR